MIEFFGESQQQGERVDGDRVHLLRRGFVSIGLLSILLLFTLLLFAFRKMRKRGEISSLRRIPGPRTYFLGSYLNLLQMADRSKTVRRGTAWCLDTKGPIMKLGIGPFQVIALFSPDYVQKLFGSMRPEHLTKPSLGYSILKPVEWFDGLFHSTGDKWKARRKLISPLLGHANIVKAVPAFNQCGVRLVQVLESHFEGKAAEGGGGEPSPIYSLLLDTFLLTFSKVIFGTDASDEDAEDYKKVAHFAKRGLEIVTTRILKPWLTLNPIFRLSSMWREQLAMSEWSLEFLRKRMEIFNERRAAADEEEGELSLFAELIKTGGLPPDGLYEETLTMMIAGYETSVIALHSTLFLLALHPSIQEMARREVDSVFEDEDLCDVNGDISEGGVAKLKYLEQCVLESLRIVPPAPVFGRELSGPLVLDEELELPAGTTVGVWIPGIHMNPKYYPNPERYDPDRFTPEARKSRHPYSFMSFSAGPRKCIGYKFAMMALLLCLAHLLRNFRIRTSSDKFEDVVWLWNITLSPESPIKFLLERRLPSAAAASHTNL